MTYWVVVLFSAGGYQYPIDWLNTRAQARKFAARWRAQFPSHRFVVRKFVEA
jgi:hypothetical protein